MKKLSIILITASLLSACTAGLCQVPPGGQRGGILYDMCIANIDENAPGSEYYGSPAWYAKRKAKDDCWQQAYEKMLKICKY